MLVIRGELLFEGMPVDLAGAAVYVRLMDVSYADAPARMVSEYHISSLPAGTSTAHKIPFEFEADIVDTKGHYSLAAHIDLDKDGKVSIGDYITMESFPVSVGSPSTFHVVRVRRIPG